MTDWMEFFLAVFGSSAMATLISNIFTVYREKKTAKSGERQALRLLMKDRLRFLCVQYIQQGWIYEDELEDLISMHGCYHNGLQGNGYLDELMSKVKKLEIRGIGR